jgi:hypothetical protein
MRQLIIALFLVVLTVIGTYYLVTQKVNLNRYYPPDSIQFPELHVPRPLTAITPGPRLTALPGFASTPTPKPPSIVHSGSGFVPHTTLRPLTIATPGALAVTPPPAPAYHVVTPLPMVPAYPTVILNPSPSPSPTP